MRTGIFRVSRLDVAVTAVVTVGTVTTAFVPYRQPWWFLVLTLSASVPVVWRRRAVLTVGGVVGGSTTVLAIIAPSLPHPPLLLLPYGVLVSVYTFAAGALSPPRRAVGIGALAFGVFVSLAVPGEDLETYRYLVTAVVAAYAVGIGARARRAARAADRERERRIREERAAAVERERTRIARDMHDIVTHSVGVMVVQAEAGSLVVRDDPDKAEAVFEAISEAGREAVGQLRLILGALRSGRPYDGPVPGVEAIPGLVGNARRAGLDAALDVRGEPRPVAADVDAAAYRVVQEALTNTIRHAGARTVAVRLCWSPDTLEIEVTDDGRGFPDLREGHGLIGMRERVAGCGGRLAVRSGGRGCTMTATLPIA
ncbi:histidine kinase [Actinoallomurus sp. NPDC052274]|uniref:sensor histidine kinase n=1 Tax=Actinoallomurus sp. NPDC052274 TaxID=3155420 RepID=UPI00343A66B5